MLEENRHLVRMGFALHRLHPQSKAPIGNDWSQRPVATYDDLKRKFKDGDNIGCRLGKWSKVDGNFVHVIDLDIRVADEADDAEAALENLFPNIAIWKFPRVKSGSGGASRHIYIVCNEAFPSKKLANSGKKIKGADGKLHWTWEIELFGTGKQVAIPPSIHPDTGKEYVWEREFSEDARLPLVDSDLIADLVYGDEDEDGEPQETSPLDLEYDEARDLVMALDDFHSFDREAWRNVGMALSHEFGRSSKAAFDIWVEFSRRDKDKFVSARDCREQWDSFKTKTDRPITMRSVIEAVNEQRRAEEYEHLADEFTDDEEDDNLCNIADEFEDIVPEPTERPRLKGIPKHLLSIPGELQQMVEYHNSTARKPQPQFAVQAALAFGSIVLSRNYTTDLDNYSSIYLVNLAPTASGKEHGQKVVDKALKAAKLERLIGPKSYTSDAGLMSSLLQQPRHINFADEMGRYLSASRGSGDANRHEAQSALMEVFGRLDGTHLGKGYSTHGMSKEQAEAVMNRRVERPALTMLGLSTPTTFYEALGMGDVTSGFLNRLLIVSSPLPRQKGNRNRMSNPPKKLITWAKEYAFPDPNDEDIGGTRELNEPAWAPDPVEIPFTSEAHDLIEQIEAEAIAEMDKHDKFGMADLFGRTVEVTLRIALIVALSCRSSKVRTKHLEWARDYVFFYNRQTADEAMRRLGQTPMQAVTDDVYALIRNEGGYGSTEREIVNFCRAYRNLNRRDRDEVLSRLKTDYGVRFKDIDKKGAGRKRKAYVAPNSDD